MIIGINAINIKSYGGKTHLVNLVNFIVRNDDFSEYDKIYIWTNSQNNKEIIKNKKIKVFIKDLNFFKSLFWNLIEFRNILKKNKVDILFLPSGIDYFYNIKKVILFQNLIPFDNNEIVKYGFSLTTLKIYFLGILYRYSIRKASGVIYLNKYSKYLIEGKIGIKAKKSKIIPHGISKNYFKTKKKKIDKSFNIIYVSSIDYYKNHITLIKAILKLQQRGFDNLKIFLVGDFINRKIQKIFESNFNSNLEISKKLVHIKYLKENEIIKLMSNMDLVCYPSSCESMGLGLIEGMASHLPVLSSNTSSLLETFNLKEFTFNPYNSTELSNLIEKIFKNKKIMEYNSKSTVEIAKNYEWRKTAQLSLKFFKECMND